MKDFEQLYYDQLYENKKLVKKIDELEQLLQVYKQLVKEKPIKKIIIDDFIKYLKRS